MFKKKGTKFSERIGVAGTDYDDLHKEKITIELRGDELAVLNNILVTALGVDDKHPVIQLLLMGSPELVESVTRKVQQPMLEMSEKFEINFKEGDNLEEGLDKVFGGKR